MARWTGMPMMDADDDETMIRHPSDDKGMRSSDLFPAAWKLLDSWRSGAVPPRQVQY